jgi:hypothetical protein
MLDSEIVIKDQLTIIYKKEFNSKTGINNYCGRIIFKYITQ